MANKKIEIELTPDLLESIWENHPVEIDLKTNKAKFTPEQWVLEIVRKYLNRNLKNYEWAKAQRAAPEKAVNVTVKE